MATTTPNFGWSVPTSTDLVKDGATAIETLGDSIDASLADLKGGTSGQVLKKNSNTDMDFVWATDQTGFVNPMTTTGDMIYSSSGSTAARLPIGTTGQVLRVSSGIPTWATATAPVTGYTLLNTGGTAMSGATSVTVSGLSGYNKLMIYIQNASEGGDFARYFCRFNSDSGGNYGYFGTDYFIRSDYQVTNWSSIGATGQSSLLFGAGTGSSGTQTNGYLQVDAANSTARKVVTLVGAGGAQAGSEQRQHMLGAFYDGTSVISSFTIFNGGGTNFDAGTINIYGAQ